MDAKEIAKEMGTSIYQAKTLIDLYRFYDNKEEWIQAYSNACQNGPVTMTKFRKMVKGIPLSKNSIVNQYGLAYGLLCKIMDSHEPQARKYTLSLWHLLAHRVLPNDVIKDTAYLQQSSCCCCDAHPPKGKVFALRWLRLDDSGVVRRVYYPICPDCQKNNVEPCFELLASLYAGYALVLEETLKRMEMI